MTIDQVSRAYGITSRTVHTWRKRAGIELQDFRDPSLVAEKLTATAKNRSPKLEALLSPKNQCLLHFRLALAGLVSPNEK
jgi:transposase-like protein